MPIPMLADLKGITHSPFMVSSLGRVFTFVRVTRRALLINCAIAVVLVTLLSRTHSLSSLFSWIVYAFACWTSIFFIFRRYSELKKTTQGKFFDFIIFSLSVIGWTSPWPIAIWFFYPQIEALQFPFSIIVLCALLATLQMLEGSYRALAGFSLLLFLPIAIRFAWETSYYVRSIGIAMILFIPAYLILTFRVKQAISEKQSLQEKSEQLIEALSRQIQQESSIRQKTQCALTLAEKACLEKSRFLAAASHDLKQPIHAISLFVAALKAETFENRSKYLVDRLDRSLNGLDELFNRLLDISHLDAGVIQPNMVVCDAVAIAQTLESRFGALAQQKALKFRSICPQSIRLRTDPQLLIELLSNLLSNALRYTEKGGVLITFRKRQAQIMIQIWDTGCGIPEGHLDTVFDEFVQLDNPARDRRKGLGLGLAIVKRLSNMLNHPIAVRSQVGHGSVFTVNVEAADDKPMTNLPLETLQAASHSIAGSLILVVEDEIDVLAAMEAVLVSWGCYVILARSTAEAVKYIDSSQRFPDLLITDHRLENHATSFDVVQCITPMLPSPIPTIVISAETNATLEREFSVMGWSYLKKPVEPRRLYEALCHSLNSTSFARDDKTVEAA